MKSIKKKPFPELFPHSFKKWEKAFFVAVFLFFFLFVSHPDLWETANHSYVFLESVFSGNFLNFYEFCAAHNNSYYYINVANYNIFMYILFGLWELPVFLFNHIFGLALNERFIWHWAKLLCALFFTGCGYMVKQIGLQLGLDRDKASMTAMFFLFNPIAFFSPVVMGQYDVICLFFALWAIVCYLKDDMKGFCLVMGVSFVFKFFSLMIFIPLLLLKEKKIPNIIKNGLLSLWLYIPSTVLFMGRTGNAAAFTKAMIDRIFAVTIDTGMRAVPVFIVIYAVIVFGCFLYTPREKSAFDYMAIYLPMVIFALLFNYIYWHPQWLVLMIPFVTLSTFMQENKAPWFYLDLVMAAGFFLFCFTNYGTQTGSVLFSGGVAGSFFSSLTANAAAHKPLSHFIGLIPYSYALAPVMFTGSLLANIIFKFPAGRRTLADRISDGDKFDKIPLKIYLYMTVVVGLVGFWFMPCLMEAVNAMGII